MKSVYMISAAAICLGLLLVGCAGSTMGKTVVRWNLRDPAVQQELDRLMGSAGISDRSRSLFFGQLEPEGRSLGKENMEDTSVGYDSRMMSYSLLEGNFLEVDKGETSLPEFPGSSQAGQELLLDPRAFKIFFAPLPIAPESREDPAELWLDSWEKRGVQIHESPRARLITVLSEKQEDTGAFLVIRQAGILFPDTQQGMQFLYRPAAQEEISLISAQSRKQLMEYLITEPRSQDTSYGKVPIFLENAVPMEVS